jgi:hypothetical protein
MNFFVFIARKRWEIVVWVGEREDALWKEEGVVLMLILIPMWMTLWIVQN